MKFPAEAMKRTWISYGAIVLLLATSVVIVLGVNRQPHQIQAHQVVNKTSIVEVVSVASDQNNNVIVTVKNVLSDRNITGLVFKQGNTNVETDFISGFGDHTIPPGKTYSWVIPPLEKGTVKASDL